MYKIESGISIPTRIKEKSIFHTMKVGDSFLLPSAEKTTVRQSASYFNRQNRSPYIFTIRKVDKDNHRCWRIA